MDSEAPVGHAEEHAAQDRARDVHGGERPGVVGPGPDQDGDAVQAEHERDEQREARVDPEERQERDEDADAEGERGPVGRVLEVKEDLRQLAGAGSLALRLPAGVAGLKWSCACGASGVRSVPARRSTPARPSANSPTTVERAGPRSPRGP